MRNKEEKMKNIIFLVVVLVVANNFQIISQDILWKKNFGLNIEDADDYGQSVIETSDGNLVITGYTNSFGAGGFDVWLIETDQNSDTLWTKTYGESGDDYAFEIEQTEDGGFIIAGSTGSFGGSGMLDGCLIKTDQFGNLQWIKLYGTTHDDLFYSIEQTEDGGYILAGERDAYPEGDSDVWILKTDSAGNFQWEKIYGSNTLDDRAYTIRKSLTGGYLVGGQNGCSGFGGCEAWLIKTNENGDTLWTKLFHSNQSTSIRSIGALPESSFIMTGMKWVSGSWDFWILKTDSLGNVEWEKTYDYDNDYDIGYSVQQTVDGGFIVAGGGNIYDWISHGWIIRTNALGDTLWTRYIKGYPSLMNVNTNSLDSYFYSIIQLTNGDYVAAGTKAQYPGNYQAWLVKLSSDIVPVELTNFTAAVNQNVVTLSWQTATETNNSGFEIERRSLSPNPSPKEKGVFKTIAFVPGFGTTTDPKSYSFIDQNLTSGKYQYRLKQIDFDGTFEYSKIVEAEINSPTEFSLEQNYPNPFNPTTKIKYTIGELILRQAQDDNAIESDILVSLKVFDVLGNEVATLVNETQPAGSYEVEFNVGQTSSLSSGVYYYQLRTGGFVETKKMILLR